MARITSDARPDLLNTTEQLEFLAQCHPRYIRRQQLVDWHRLERNRQKRLGIANNRSVQRFNVTRSHSGGQVAQIYNVDGERPENENDYDYPSRRLFAKGPNTWAPFYSVYKNTCGFFFKPNTDHKKRFNPIPPSNIAAWRTDGRETQIQ